ncbi:hypothetical protein BDW62DRAFT_212210 [Aspergillus aurantiobrunneus]
MGHAPVHMNLHRKRICRPASRLDSAVTALASTGIHHCTDAACPELNADQYPNNRHQLSVIPATGQHILSPQQLGEAAAKNRYHIRADRHFHLQTQRRPPCWCTERGSSTGPWIDRYPVKSLRSAKLYEAVTLLWCLYWGHAENADYLIGKMSSSIFAELVDLVYAEIRDWIKPEFKSIFNDMQGRTKERKEPGAYFFELLRLRKRLLAGQLTQSKNLPALPPFEDGEDVQLPEDRHQ